MPLPLETRNPNLVARVDESIERARSSAGLSAEGRSALGGLSLGALLAEETAHARKTHTLPGSSLETIPNPETSRAFKQAFAETARLYERIGLKAPTAVEIATGGINLGELARQYEAEQATGREPELVLASYGLDAKEWRHIYQNLADDRGANHDARIRSCGLWISDGIVDNWHDLTNITVAPDDMPAVAGTDTMWTLRIIPATDRPTETGVDHNANGGVHPTIPEYLTLQATRLQAGKPPVDGGDTWTWLAGDFNGASQAPFGYWSPGDGRVGLGWNGVVIRSVNLGVRPPVC